MSENIKVKIIDSIMGSGKTSYAIQRMNEDVENNYIYITPFLSEVQRIKDNCTSRKFYEPFNVGSGKLDSLHNLLKDGKNIASTHALFRLSNEVTKDLIQANNYVLILDEVCDVIEQIPLKKDDLPSILELGLATIEDGFLIWNPDCMDYDGRYNDTKQMALNKTLIVVNDCLLMWNFPVEVFKAFKECYIMTYVFRAQIQRYYYDLHDIEYEYYTILKDGDSYNITKYSDTPVSYKSFLKEKINILENDIINDIGNKDFSLSSSWFDKATNRPLIQTLKRNVYNYFQQKVKAKSKEILWTTFKTARPRLNGKGYTKSFLSCNARATNEYRDRVYLAYCANIFFNPIIKNFFNTKKIDVLEDDYALSELLQWIWRSAIREGNEIFLYIPSKRMRSLLTDWLDGKI